MKHPFLFIVIAVVLCSQIGSAQPDTNEKGRRPSAERIESYKKVRLMEELKMDETLSIKFFARYNKHREVMKGFEKEWSDVVDRLDSQVKSGASDADYTKTLADVREVGKRMHEARQNFVNELKDILSNKQIAQYIVFERTFSRNLRDMARDLQTQRNQRH